ncbi:MBL fold metallo-hydrolase [Neotamlana laminarinivorans]|uniref:MBL fold metallo-hydrolase n=1 Tax=Neotamlana laminarinivorans TaxID=2883124 RepID=A0A9X1I2T5_9FLAO|nr:MBL fold metallo-hydrolase [Tamlana laminarinivorans]MCB4799282.1 MBL fold metallo-hydrolase [Tamlana laminarinivorans]
MKNLDFYYFLFFCCTIISASAQNKKDIIITTTPLTENIYMLEGQGGNIGLSIGADGILMIDSQFAGLTPKILEAIKTLSDKPIKFLANTHHHGDHTGGNENIATLNTPIIAHNNVYNRIKANTKQSKKALPVITFNSELNVYINNEEVMMIHVDNAHTDGDAVIYFTESNVLHTGDTFFNGRYPYIDLKSGGSVNGYINAVKKSLMLIDENTKIIPGHGSVATTNDYKTFLNMLETLKTNVLAEIEKGKTENEVAKNTSLTKIYDDLNYGCCFISSEKIRRIFYTSLKKD